MVMMNWMPTMAHSVTCQEEAVLSSSGWSGVGVWRGSSIIRAAAVRVFQRSPQQWHAAVAPSNLGRRRSCPRSSAPPAARSIRESEAPPAHCTICREERQYVNPLGQSWTTLQAMRRTHVNGFRQYEPGLTGIGTHPSFAIGQRALLVQTPAFGNVLWDCISLLDDPTIAVSAGARRDQRPLPFRIRTSTPRWSNGAMPSNLRQSLSTRLTASG